MKNKAIIFLSAILAFLLVTGCTSLSSSNEADAVTQDAPVSVRTVELTTASVTVYDYGDIKLHSFFTNDVLGDVAYIVEGDDALVGIELPAFTAGLEEWTGYIASLGKSMNNIFVCDHPAGASYVEGMDILGTEGAAVSIKGGSTYATTQGLYMAFGEDFHGGDDIAYVNKTVSGEVEVDGIAFRVIDNGETYDLVIPALNVIYTHMLGKTTHSILTGTGHMDAMSETLRGYQAAGYAMILTSHGGPEGQDAVIEKLEYLEKTKEIAVKTASYEEFLESMTEAFPDYDGVNYLEMTAGYLFQ